MAAVEAVLAVVGAGFLAVMGAALVGGAFSQGTPTTSDSAEIAPADDPALPYREALYAAIRIQQAAQEAERELFAEAKLHTDKQVEP